MSKNRHTYRIEKQKRKRRRLIMWVFAPILILILSATAYGAHLYKTAEEVANKSYKEIDFNGTEKKQKETTEVKNTSILFIGVDDSEARGYNESSRTDALVVATLNEEDKSIKLLSIPRDSYVYLPEEGYYTKINHAHAHGGVKSTILTVEELLDIPIDEYVKMNFEAFIEVVDALGGIEAEVPYALSEKDSKDRNNAINLQAGLQNLNGEEALALARTRNYDNDIERGKRQQEIIKAILKKGLSVSSITKYADVMEAIGENMTTSLSFSEMKDFLNYATAGSNLSTETLSLQGGDNYIDGVYYYQLDEAALEQTKQTLKTHLQVSSADDPNRTTSIEDEDEVSYNQ